MDLSIDGPESVILMAGDDLRLVCQVNDDTYGSPMWLDAQGHKVSEGILDFLLLIVSCDVSCD